jgi:hypothetical protein
MVVFWVVTPCSLVETDWCFRGAIALMMEAVRTSETSVYFSETTLSYIPEGSRLQSILWCFKSVKKYVVYTALISYNILEGHVCAKAVVFIIYYSLFIDWLRGARTQRFITAFTKARNRSQSWANRIHSTPPSQSPRYPIWSNPPIYDSVFRVNSFLRILPPKIFKLVSPLPCVCHVPPTSFSLIWSS